MHKKMSNQHGGSFAIKAHTFALAAEDSFNAGKYKEAGARHHTAHTYFDKIKQVMEKENDPATAKALQLLSSYHKTKSREMKKRGKQNESLENSSQITSSSSVSSSSSSIDSSSKSKKKNNEKSPKQKQESVAAFKKVIGAYEDVKLLIENQNDFEEETFDEISPKIPSSTNTNLMQRALGESFYFVPRTGNLSTAKNVEEEGKQVVLLQQKIEMLSKENVNLSRDLQKANKLINMKNERLKQVEHLKTEYKKKFALLKLCMEHFQDAYAEGDHDGRRKILEKKVADSAEKQKYYKKKWESEKEKRKLMEERIQYLKKKLESATVAANEEYHAV